MLLSRPQQAREGQFRDLVAALYALLSGTRRLGRPHWLRCELHAASHLLPRLTSSVAASYAKTRKKRYIALVLHYIALVLHLLMLAWQGDAVALCGALLRPHRAQAAAGRASLAHIRTGGGRRGLEKQFSARNQLRSMLGACDALRCSEVPKCRSSDACIMCCTYAWVLP